MSKVTEIERCLIDSAFYAIGEFLPKYDNGSPHIKFWCKEKYFPRLNYRPKYAFLAFMKLVACRQDKLFIDGVEREDLGARVHYFFDVHGLDAVNEDTGEVISAIELAKRLEKSLLNERTKRNLEKLDGCVLTCFEFNNLPPNIIRLNFQINCPESLAGYELYG
jgi:hypothetical protein